MSEKRGVLSRADLVKTLADPMAADWVAESLCLTKMMPESADETGEGLCFETLSVSSLVAEGDLLQTNKRPPTHFWYLDSRDRKVNDKEQQSSESTLTLQANEVVDEAWSNRPSTPPVHIPLLESIDLLSRLQPFLMQETASRKVDLDKVVDIISHGENLSRIPKKNKKRQQRHLHIIDDRSRHLTPYWKDHDLAKLALLEQMQGKNISFSVLVESDEQPQQLTQQGLGDWQCPRQSLVLVLGDLGVLQRYSNRRQQTWEQLGQQLKQLQCTSLVLSPSDYQQIDTNLRSLFQMLSWQESLQRGREDDVTLLLNFIAPCIRIEPGLIRQMRLTLGLPAEIESAVWQHPAIQSPHSVAATWNTNLRKDYLKGFSALSEAERTTALNVIRAWREPLDKQIWYEEAVSLSEDCQNLPSIQADVAQAQQYFVALSEQFQDESALEAKHHTQSWCRRVLKRLPSNSLRQSPALQKIAERVHKDDPDFDASGINPQNLLKSLEPLRQAVVCQRANALCLKLYDPYNLPERSYSHLALISLRRDWVQLTQGDQDLGRLMLESNDRIKLQKNTTIQIHSDQETLTLRSQTAPKNVAMGCDIYGLFADVILLGITQRFRYIEPTTFMMGLQENEKDNPDYEDYHQVTLTQGYWLADTACTQELWQAVMGENPSDFRTNPLNPVENISWVDVHSFIAKLKQQTPELIIQLPSEAQWENACRAGTQTPFYFGGNVTPEQVNYDGNHPYTDGKKGEHRQKTVPVKSLPPNAWGLYEMHGNVLEWCIDEWKEKLGNDSKVDPVRLHFKSGLQPEQSGGSLTSTSSFNSKILENADDPNVRRVLRGGSWDDFGRSCRSALRNRNDADSRNRRIGFRLSLGLELQHSVVLRSDKAPGSEQTEQNTKRRGAAQGLDQSVSASSKGVFDKVKSRLGRKSET